MAYFIYHLERTAVSYGFPESQARKIVEETFRGTLQHLEVTGMTARHLIENVATKGGITEEVLKKMEAQKFYQMLKRSIDKGYTKIREIILELEHDYL